MRKILTVTAALAVSAGLFAAPAQAETYNPGKTVKTEFLNEVNATQPVDCYNVTFSDRFKNWAKVTSNVNSPRTCSLYEGEIWYKRPIATGKWEFVDAGYSDLIVGVPAAVEKEFTEDAKNSVETPSAYEL